MRSLRSRPRKGCRRLSLLLPAIALVSIGCGSDAPSQPTPPPPPASSFTVSSITDGDTLRFSPALEGTTILRMLHVDAPEIAQRPWGEQSSAELLRLAPAGTTVRLETEQTHIDAFGRLLGHAIRSDGLDLNREQLRLGQAVLYVIWPERRTVRGVSRRRDRGAGPGAGCLEPVLAADRAAVRAPPAHRSRHAVPAGRRLLHAPLRRAVRLSPRRRQQPGVLQQLDGCRYRRVRALSADRHGRLQLDLLRRRQIAAPKKKNARTSMARAFVTFVVAVLCERAQRASRRREGSGGRSPPD